jgi:hypothetical protein
LEALRTHEESAASDQRAKQDDVEQQAPSGAQSVGAKEYSAQGKTRRRRQNRRGNPIDDRGGLGRLRLAGFWLVSVRQMKILG